MYSIFFLFLILLCGSCSSSYSYKEKYKPESNVNLDKNLSDATKTDLFTSCNMIETDWWKEFEDEQLNSFIEIALGSNPTLKTAEEKIRIANQESLMKKASLFPTLQGVLKNLMVYQNNKALSLLHDRHTDHLTSLEFELNYDVDVFFKNRKEYEVLVGVKKMQEAEYSQSKLLLTTAICQNYFRIQGNMIKLEILLEILSKRAKNLELISLRQKNGIDNSIMVNNAIISVAGIEKQAAILKEELVLGKNLLNILLGYPPNHEIDIDSSFRLINKPILLPKFVGSDLLAHRPDLTAIRYKIYSLASKVGVSKAEFLPNVNLAAMGGLANIDYADFFTSKSLTGSFLPSISLPIFTGGFLNASLKANISRLKSANYEFRQALLSATKQVVDSIEKIQTTSDTLKFQAQETKSAKHNYGLVLNRYKSGIDSMISVLSKNEDFLMQRLEQISLQHQQIQNKIQLIKSIGGGYESTK